MATRIQTRNGTSALWTSTNPILAVGELGVENDTKKIKAGDGVTAWISLAYVDTSVAPIDSLVNGNLSAVTSNAVFDGLALKAPLDNPSFTGQVNATGDFYTPGSVIADTGGFVTETGDFFTDSGDVQAGTGNIQVGTGQFIGAGTGLTGTAANLVAGAALTILRTTAQGAPVNPGSVMTISGAVGGFGNGNYASGGLSSGKELYFVGSHAIFWVPTGAGYWLFSPAGGAAVAMKSTSAVATPDLATGWVRTDTLAAVPGFAVTSASTPILAIGQMCRVGDAAPYTWYRAETMTSWVYNDRESRVFYTSTYGAHPSATAAANVLAMQAALDAANSAGGGRVMIDIAGIYLLSNLISIGDNTDFTAVNGVTLKQTNSVTVLIINKSIIAGTGWNYDISISNLTIDCNGLGGIDPPGIPRMNGHITMCRVDGCFIERVKTINLHHSGYANHFPIFKNLTMRHCFASGNKDFVNLGPGTTALFENCTAATFDDMFGIWPATYPIVNTETGDISDIKIINCTYLPAPSGNNNGFGVRWSNGAWGAWVSGLSCREGRRANNAGRVYTCMNVPVEPTSSTVAPVHTSGIVTGADGIAWLMDHVGTDTTAMVKNLHIENMVNKTSTASIYCQSERRENVYNNPVTPGQESNIWTDTLTIIGGEYAPPVGSATYLLMEGWIKVVKIIGATVKGATTNFIFGISETDAGPTADPRTAHTTKMTVTNCEFEGGGVVAANRQNLTIDFQGSALTLPDSGLTVYGGLTGKVRLRGDFKPYNLSEIKAMQHGDIVGDYVFRRDSWFYKDRSGDNHLVRKLIPIYVTNSGVSSSASLNDGSKVYLQPGTAALGFAMARMSRNMNTLTGLGTNFSHPFIISGEMIGGAIQGSSVRLLLGVNESYNSGFVANGSVNPFAAAGVRGIGIEFYRPGASGNLRARIIGHNGTDPVVSADVVLGTGAAYNAQTSYMLTNLGNGTYNLYVNAAIETNRLPRIPTTPSATITNGPTGNGSSNNTGVWAIVTADGTTATALNDAVALFTYPELEYKSF